MLTDPYKTVVVPTTLAGGLVEDAKRWRSVMAHLSGPPKPPALTPTLMGSADQRWVHEQLKRYVYKPTFTVEVRPVPVPVGAYAPVTVHMQMMVLDARGSERVMPTSMTLAVPHLIVDSRDADQLGIWLRHCIQRMEDHEIDEWFRRDGEIVDDPHRRPA